MERSFYKNLAIVTADLAIIAGLSTVAPARDSVLPAGTILQCTLDEPNFSSSTAEVGDPVLCHLRQVAEFGEQVFPRGSYLVGHLESAKEPGYFFGKGNLKVQFDRLGLPMGDFPLDTKVIAVHGYKVDGEGKINGKGHAKRDALEWMLPPLWPWKVIMLPARGPRPKLKGETAISLRLMDDVQIPEVAQPLAQQFGELRRQSYRKSTPDLREPAVRDPGTRGSQRRKCGETFGPEWHFFGQPRCESLRDSQSDTLKAEANTLPSIRRDDAGAATVYAAYVSEPSERDASKAPSGTPMFVMKTGTALAVDNYAYQKGRITYTLAGGENGVIKSGEVDWAATLRVNASRGLRITLRGKHPGS
jgi:hypothetical protein